MKLKYIAFFLCLVLTLSSFTSCGMLRGADETGASTQGAGRETSVQTEEKTPADATVDSEDGETEPDESESESESESADESDTEEGSETDEEKPTVSIEGGFTGSLNVPDDLSFVYSVPQGHFSDKNPDDLYGCWYPGSVSRDLTTGVVTWKWDRAAETLDIVEKYNGIYRGKEGKKVIYLTFDCGYEYRPEDGSYPDGVTADILDTMKEKNAPGTFFVTGDYLNAEPGLVGRMLDEGHIVGNHTLSHPSPNMTSLTPEQFVSEIKDNNDLLKKYIPDAPDMVYYRPPEGGACEWTMALSYAMGLKTVFWSAIEPNDHVVTAQKDPATVLQNNKEKLHDGAVYLIHAVSVSNAQMLGDFIDYVRAEGYEIKPLSEFEG